MNTEEFEAMQGHVSALYMTVTTLITTLTPVAAAQAAAHLAVEDQETKALDAQDEIPPAMAQARDAAIQSVMRLLQAVSKRG